MTTRRFLGLFRISGREDSVDATTAAGSADSDTGFVSVADRIRGLHHRYKEQVERGQKMAAVIAELRKYLLDLEQEQAALKEELTETRKQLAAREEQENRAANAPAPEPDNAAEEKIAALAEEIRTLKQTNADVREDRTEKLNKLNGRLKEANERAKAANERVKTVQERLADTREKFGALREERNELMGEYRALRNRTRWVAGEDTSQTGDWDTVRFEAPLVMQRGNKIRVLLLNSMGGSMSRLGKALMMHEGIEADCVVGAWSPRRHLLYPNEANVYGVFSHQEWRDYIAWAVRHYDIVQSTSFPIWPKVAELYDWLTDHLGRRHIWRETGFIHHFLLREDVLPVEYYREMLRTDQTPDPSRFTGQSFRFDETHVHTDPWVVFYSSPEKGAYMKGNDTHWMPSIRDPDIYFPDFDKTRDAGDPALIYVPYHKAANWKGLGHVLSVLDEMKREGANIEVVTPVNARQFFPDLISFRDEDAENPEDVPYPIPNHILPELYRRVDLVVDQVVMGCYGNTGIEAMLCGKPVVGQKRYEDVSDAPVIDVTRENLRERLEELLQRRSEWNELGRASREYAIRLHSPAAVAARAATVYRRVMDEDRQP